MLAWVHISSFPPAHFALWQFWNQNTSNHAVVVVVVSRHFPFWFWEAFRGSYCAQDLKEYFSLIFFPSDFPVFFFFIKQFLICPFCLVTVAGWQELTQSELSFFILGKTKNEDFIWYFGFYSKQVIPKNALRHFPKASSSSSCAISYNFSEFFRSQMLLFTRMRKLESCPGICSFDMLSSPTIKNASSLPSSIGLCF